MSDQNNGSSREEQRTQSFNPKEHIIQIKNKGDTADYLPVQWRLVWFREQCPNGTIDTEEVEVDLDREVEVEAYAWNNETRRSEKIVKRARGYARFRAVVTDGKGGRATGTKSETAANFPDFIEKAETGAIGRALAALGYGTQFAPELNEEHRIVDAPVERPHLLAPSPHNGEGAEMEREGVRLGEAIRSTTVSGNGSASSIATDEKAPATEQQLASIRKLCQHLGKPEPEDQETLTYLGAKELITQLSREYNEQRQSRSKKAS